MRWILLLLSMGIGGWAAELRIDPSFQRLDLQADQVVAVPITLRCAPGTAITAAVVDCACIHSETALPLTVPTTGTATLIFRVTGLRPGVEDILVATSAGIARAQLQIVGPGAGRGIDVLQASLAEAARQHWTLLGVAHDLRGQVRHCACSHGSLGAADRLAALPTAVHTLAPDLETTWILSGDSDGQRPGVGAALASAGWRLQDPRIVVTADPTPLLTRDGVVAIIPTTPVAMQHRLLLRPVLDGGLAVELLLVDAAGQIQQHHTMPVDDSLAADPVFAARFPDALTWRIDPTAEPSTDCTSCHTTAHQAWLASPHAQAWARLAVPDHTDACITCHTTLIVDRVRAPAVHCQACHQGGTAHADSGGTTHTTGTMDCRSCHDAQHDPGFRREVAWPRILHGAEPKTAP